MRRGAVLFELLVALAVFVVAASTLLATFGDVLGSIDRDTTTARAVDLARTRMSELEAGLVTIEDLRSEGPRATSGGQTGSAEANGADAEDEATNREGLFVTASTTRSAFPGLTLVEIRVFQGEGSVPRFVLRQLMAMPEDRTEGGDLQEVELSGSVEPPRSSSRDGDLP